MWNFTFSQFSYIENSIQNKLTKNNMTLRYKWIKYIQSEKKRNEKKMKYFFFWTNTIIARV